MESIEPSILPKSNAVVKHEKNIFRLISIVNDRQKEIAGNSHAEI